MRTLALTWAMKVPGLGSWNWLLSMFCGEKGRWAEGGPQSRGAPPGPTSWGPLIQQTQMGYGVVSPAGAEVGHHFWAKQELEGRGGGDRASPPQSQGPTAWSLAKDPGGAWPFKRRGLADDVGHGGVAWKGI